MYTLTCNSIFSCINEVTIGKVRARLFGFLGAPLSLYRHPCFNRQEKVWTSMFLHKLSKYCIIAHSCIPVCIMFFNSLISSGKFHPFVIVSDKNLLTPSELSNFDCIIVSKNFYYLKQSPSTPAPSKLRTVFFSTV